MLRTLTSLLSLEGEEESSGFRHGIILENYFYPLLERWVLSRFF